MGVMLADEFGRWLGRPVPVTVVWDYPTIASMTRHLAGQPGPATRDPESKAGHEAAGMESLLSELEQLSEAEARAALEAGVIQGGSSDE